MGWFNAQQATAEADDYDKAGDKAAKAGDLDAAEMFHGFAVDKRKEAQREATGVNPDSGRRRGKNN